MNSLLAQLDNLLLALFGLGALAGAVTMIIARQPMRVAMALISTMVLLGGVYGLLGVHFIAAFQVLIYVGAVMVFMVYVIMLLDPRDAAYRQRYSWTLIPGALFFFVLLAVLLAKVSAKLPAVAPAGPAGFSLAEFSRAFLNEYWLHFELTSVLLVAGVVAAMAVIKVSRDKEGKPHG